MWWVSDTHFDLLVVSERHRLQERHAHRRCARVAQNSSATVQLRLRLGDEACRVAARTSVALLDSHQRIGAQHQLEVVRRHHPR